MPKYEVNIKETNYGFVTVEAKNEDEAVDKAHEAWSNGSANYGKSELNCTEITKID